MRIYTTVSGEFADLAEEIAVERGGQVINDLTSLADEPVVWVDHPSNIDSSGLLRLQKRSLDKGPENGQFSVITGYTPKMARRLYERETNHESGEHAVLVQHPHTSLTAERFDTDEDATVLLGNDATVKNLREIQQDGLTSLAVQTHGWPIHLNLADGFVCGYPTTQNVADYDEPQPYCVQDGEIDCPFDEEIIAAEELTPEHVFLVSCASMIDNGWSGLPVHVGMGLLNGATSLIGSYRPGASLPHEPILHYVLLRAGYTLSERCYLLNQHSHVNDVMAYPYVPFGHPDASVAGSGPSETVEVDADDEGVVLSADPQGAFLVDTSIPLDVFDEPIDRAYVRNLDDDPQKVRYYMTFREGDELRVVLYSGGRMHSPFEVRVSPTPIDQRKRERYLDSYHNAEDNRNLGILSSKAERQTDNLRQLVRNLPEKVSSEKYDPNVYHEVREQIDEIDGTAKAIGHELTSVANKGEYFQNYYRTRAIDDDVFAADVDCFSCGRETLIKQISDGDETYRAMGVCSHCGHVYDVPTADGERCPPHPTVSGDFTCTDEQVRELEVSFENPTEYELDAMITLSLRHEGNTTADDEHLFDPPAVQATIPIGESITASFSLDTARIADNQHYLLARVVANNAVYSGNAVLLVGEKTGFLQPWHR
ncbi:hypothetical protein [Haladaptatus cibarius]|uniref:hypothetical protein n=1 Tax=Haladaptatus cibarius TaxID=453847 RepID=UPI00067921D6|nr:hypothetical protein [Haladaptatus cibarius]